MAKQSRIVHHRQRSHLMRRQHRLDGPAASTSVVLHPSCTSAPFSTLLGGAPNDRQSLSVARYSADNGGMDNLTSVAALLVAGVGLGLYIMRRRSRLGKRTPRF